MATVPPHVVSDGGDLTWIGGVIGGLLGGSGLKWVFDWWVKREERRFNRWDQHHQRNREREKELDERERAIEAAVAQKLAICEEKCTDVQRKLDEGQELTARLVLKAEHLELAVRLLVPAVARLDAAAPELTSAREILKSIYPVRTIVPDSMKTLITEIDSGHRSLEDNSTGP